MSITYLQAFEVLNSVAQELSPTLTQDEEKVPLLSSIGRLNARPIRSRSSIPAFDTSAMDGYALNSSLTLRASIDAPVFFFIAGTIAAGDKPTTLQNSSRTMLPCCSEIMTGAQFPYDEAGRQLDACLPVELAELIDLEGELHTCLKIVSPVRENQNRRFAGSDINIDHVILERGELISLQHIMALTTLGVSHIDVVRKVQVAVCSTGSEIVPFDSKECSPHHIRDSNSPYIRQVLEQCGVNVTLFTIVRDDVAALGSMMQQFLQDDSDILITTGGVSAGKFDLVRESIEDLGATIHFHKVAIRPGHPILFGTFNHVPTKDSPRAGVHHHKRKAIFGLPGNSIAAAACLQFFVIPFLKRLRGESYPKPVLARVKDFKQNIPSCNRGGQALAKRTIDIFRHGHLQLSRHGFEVTTNHDQASYKVGPITQSNCWVWFPYHQSETLSNNTAQCFPFSPLDDFFGNSSISLKPKDHTLLQGDTWTDPTANNTSRQRLKIAILAGGFSTRMKSPKHLAQHRNDQLAYEVLLEEILKAVPNMQQKDIHISLRNDEQVLELKQTHFIHNYDLLPCSTITDTIATNELHLDQTIGPAAGILSAHMTDPTATWLILACDFPLLTSNCLIQLLQEHNTTHGPTADGPSITCFVNKDGFHEPLLAVWTPTGLEQLKHNVLNGIHGPSRTIRDLAKMGRVRSVVPTEERWIMNANTPAELEACLASCTTE